MAIGFALLPDDVFRPLVSLDDLAALWPEGIARVWVDLESPSEQDVQRLGRIVGLDEEALGDCLHGQQQPRVDEFENYILLVLYGLHGLTGLALP